MFEPYLSSDCSLQLTGAYGKCLLGCQTPGRFHKVECSRIVHFFGYLNGACPSFFDASKSLKSKALNIQNKKVKQVWNDVRVSKLRQNCLC